MYWILRRTGAKNLFNSLNNNCTSSKDNGGRYNANATQDKYVKRPPRKAYGRLSAVDDDTVSVELTIDDSFGDVDNFQLFGCPSRSRNEIEKTRMEISVNGTPTAPMRHQIDSFGNLKDFQCLSADCQPNLVAKSDLCDLNSCNNNGNDSILLSNSTTANEHQQKELDGNSITRLNMTLADQDEYDESLTCNVCDRSFHCHRQLASHQLKKRHFGCSGCDSLFPSLMLLEHHKEEFEHWSDYESDQRNCCRRNQDDYFTDTDSYTSEAESEDLERLL